MGSLKRAAASKAVIFTNKAGGVTFWHRKTIFTWPSIDDFCLDPEFSMVARSTFPERFTPIRGRLKRQPQRL
jgi:hypothetical protein